MAAASCDAVENHWDYCEQEVNKCRGKGSISSKKKVSTKPL
jgi:hypothetical protein